MAAHELDAASKRIGNEMKNKKTNGGDRLRNPPEGVRRSFDILPLHTAAGICQKSVLNRREFITARTRHADFEKAGRPVVRKSW